MKELILFLLALTLVMACKKEKETSSYIKPGRYNCYKQPKYYAIFTNTDFKIYYTSNDQLYNFHTYTTTTDSIYLIDKYELIGALESDNTYYYRYSGDTLRITGYADLVLQH